MKDNAFEEVLEQDENEVLETEENTILDQKKEEASQLEDNIADKAGATEVLEQPENEMEEWQKQMVADTTRMRMKTNTIANQGGQMFKSAVDPQQQSVGISVGKPSEEEILEQETESYITGQSAVPAGVGTPEQRYAAMEEYKTRKESRDTFNVERVKFNQALEDNKANGGNLKTLINNYDAGKFVSSYFSLYDINGNPISDKTSKVSPKTHATMVALANQFAKSGNLASLPTDQLKNLLKVIDTEDSKLRSQQIEKLNKENPEMHYGEDPFKYKTVNGKKVYELNPVTGRKVEADWYQQLTPVDKQARAAQIDQNKEVEHTKYSDGRDRLQEVIFNKEKSKISIESKELKKQTINLKEENGGSETLRDAQAFQRNTDELLAAPDKFRDYNFWEGVANYAKGIYDGSIDRDNIPFVGGALEAKRYARVAAIINKSKGDIEKLNEEERVLLNSYLKYTEALATIAPNYNEAYKIGEMSGESAAFMAEMFAFDYAIKFVGKGMALSAAKIAEYIAKLSTGSKTARFFLSATEKGLKGGAKAIALGYGDYKTGKLGTKIFRMPTMVVKGAETPLAEMGAKAAGAAVQTFAMSNYWTSRANAKVDAAMEGRKDLTLKEEIALWYTANTEVFTEAALNTPNGVISEFAFKALGRITPTFIKTSKIMDRLIKSQVARNAMRFQSGILKGTPEELLEEYEGAAINWLGSYLFGDPTMREDAEQLFTLKGSAEMVGSMAFQTIVMGGVQTGIAIHKNREYVKNKETFVDALAESMSGDRQMALNVIADFERTTNPMDAMAKINILGTKIKLRMTESGMSEEEAQKATEEMLTNYMDSFQEFSQVIDITQEAWDKMSEEEKAAAKLTFSDDLKKFKEAQFSQAIVRAIEMKYNLKEGEMREIIQNLNDGVIDNYDTLTDNQARALVDLLNQSHTEEAISAAQDNARQEIDAKVGNDGAITQVTVKGRTGYLKSTSADASTCTVYFENGETQQVSTADVEVEQVMDAETQKRESDDRIREQITAKTEYTPGTIVNRDGKLYMVGQITEDGKAQIMPVDAEQVNDAEAQNTTITTGELLQMVPYHIESGMIIDGQRVVSAAETEQGTQVVLENTEDTTDKTTTTLADMAKEYGTKLTDAIEQFNRGESEEIAKQKAEQAKVQLRDMDEIDADTQAMINMVSRAMQGSKGKIIDAIANNIAAVEKSIADLDVKIAEQQAVIDDDTATFENKNKAQEKKAKLVEQRETSAKEAEAMKNAKEYFLINDAQVNATLREMVSKAGVGVEVVRSVSDLPNTAAGENARKAAAKGRLEGFYDTTTNKVYLISDNLSTAQRVRQVFVHEVFAHKGLKELLGTRQFNQFLDKVWEGMSDEAKEQMKAYVMQTDKVFRNGKTWEDLTEEELRREQRAAADEYVAHLAEKAMVKGELAADEKSAWQTIIDLVKEFLNKIFGDTQVTDADIVKMLNYSYSAQVAKIRESREVVTIEEESSEYPDTHFSIVTDQAELDRLNNDKNGYIEAYAYMAKMDGKYYPPMASKVSEDGKRNMVPSMKVNDWVKSDESKLGDNPTMLRENKKNGHWEYNLIKPDGSSMWVAYNPYLHSTLSPLNDQFSAAYSRPELVMVKVRIPKSDLDGYQAEGAKNSVGEMPWKAGPVSSKLAGTENERKVILSRYRQIVGEVDAKDEANAVADILNKYNLSMPVNAVRPQLREELAKLGVKFDKVDDKINVKEGERDTLNKWVEENGDVRFSVDWGNNTGYTQKDNGRRLSNNALGAEEEGKFTKKDFCKRYGVAKEDFDMLEKIGIIKTNEWHHVGTKFKKENFYEWADWSDKDYENGNVESGSLAEVYQQNKKDIGRLTAEYNAKKWKYQGKETLSYVPTFEEWVGMQSKEDYLTDQDKEDRRTDHDRISNSADLYNAFERRTKRQSVDEYYNNIAYERMIKDDDIRKQYNDFKKQEDTNNKTITTNNAEVDKFNNQTDGKEKVIKQVADILNTEINIDAISRQAQNDERFAAREQAMEEWKADKSARIENTNNRREEWLQKKLKAGSIKEVSRVPEKDKPEFFVETKREMNGRYGWFESRFGYNLPEYLSGYDLINKRNKNTYDEFGKEIAEINNEIFADTRFSITPEQDQEYMDAVNSGDMEKAGEMVKVAFKAAYPNTKVVDENGEPLVVYHGSPRWFTEFKPQTSHANNINTPEGAYFFSKLRDNAQSYTSKKGSVELNPKKIGTRKVLNNNGEYEEIKDIKGGIYSVFLNITNPLIVDYKGNNWSATEMIYEATDWSEEEDAQFKTEEEREKWMNERKSEGHDVSSRRYEQPVDGLKETNIYIDSAISSGRYDGAIFTNIDDYGSYPHSNHEITDEFIAFQPNQIKSAEPVTYDDEGNVIPLSERFSESDDIRYSVADTEAERDRIMSDIEDEIRYSQSVVGPQFREDGFESESMLDYMKRHAEWAKNYNSGLPVIAVEEMPQFDAATMSWSQYLKARAAYNKQIELHDAEKQFRDSVTALDKFNLLVERSLFQRFANLRHWQERLKKFAEKNGIEFQFTPDMDMIEAFAQSSSIASRMMDIYKNTYQKELAAAEARITGRFHDGRYTNADQSKSWEPQWTWQNVDSKETPEDKKRNGKRLTPHEIVSLYLQAKDALEAEQLGLPDRGLDGFVEQIKSNAVDADGNPVVMSAEEVVSQFEYYVDEESRDRLHEAVFQAAKFALKYELDGGLIDKETYDKFFERDEEGYYKRKFYVPERGWAYDEYDDTTVFADPLRAAKGRDSLAADPIEYLITIGNSAILATEKNRVRQSILEMAMANEDLGMVTGAFQVAQMQAKRLANGKAVDMQMPLTDDEVEADKKINEQIEGLQQQIREKRKERRKLKEDYEIMRHSKDTEEETLLQVKGKIEALTNEIKNLGRQMDAIVKQRVGLTYAELLEERKQDRKKDNEKFVTVIKDGKRYQVNISEKDVARNANGLHVDEALDTTLKARQNDWKGNAAKLTRAYAMTKTQLSYNFAGSNFMRDVQFAFMMNCINHNLVFATNAFRYSLQSIPVIMGHFIHDNLGKEMAPYDKVFGEASDLFSKFAELGGITGYSFMQEMPELKKLYKDMLIDAEHHTGEKGVGNYDLDWLGEWIRKNAKKGLDVMSFLSEVSELMTRFGQFRAYLDYAKRKNRGTLTDNDYTEAAREAKNITVNFNITGQLGERAGWLYMFTNATLQGMHTPLRAIRKSKKAKAKFAGICAGWVLAGMAAELFAPDDPDDEKYVPDWMNKTTVSIGSKGFQWYLPHFFRMFYYAGNQMMKAMRGKITWGQASYNAIANLFEDNLPPFMRLMDFFEITNKGLAEEVTTWDFNEKMIRNMSPSIPGPIVDLLVNSNYAGIPIYKEPFNESRANNPIYNHYKNTSEWAIDFSRWLQEKTGGNPDDKSDERGMTINPAIIDYVANQFFTGTLSDITKLVSFGIDVASDGKIDSEVKDIPVYGKFFRPYDQSRMSSAAFYDVNTLGDTYKNLSEDRKAQLKGDEKEIYEKYYKGSHSFINNCKKKIKDNGTLSSDEIRLLLDIKTKWVTGDVDAANNYAPIDIMYLKNQFKDYVNDVEREKEEPLYEEKAVKNKQKESSGLPDLGSKSSKKKSSASMSGLPEL